MGETRGPTGTVLGMAAWEVTRLLADLLDALGSQFTRAQAATWLRERGGSFDYHDGAYVYRVDLPEKVEAWLAALGKCPGVTAVPGKARFECDLRAPNYARHRTWRMALPHVDVADATVLHRLLHRHRHQLTPRLDALRLRLDAGLEKL